MFEPRCVTLSCSSEDGGIEFVEEISANCVGDDVTRRFNVRYLIDALEQVETDHVELGIGLELGIMTIESGSYLALIMPMTRPTTEE